MKLFHKLNLVDFNAIDLLRKEVSLRTDWFESHGFNLIRIDKNMFFKPELIDIMQQFKGRAVCIKMNPMTWYDWHTDAIRSCAINMLIDGTKSMCFFGDRQSRDIVNLTELHYEIGSVYLLNTQTKHAVLNLDNERYMLSIGFGHPYTYLDVLNYCLARQL